MSEVHSKGTSLTELEKAAGEKMSSFARGYYSHPGEGGQTYRDNCQAFKRYRLIPRNLRDVNIRDTSVTVLGSRLDLPVAIAPTAVHKVAHPDAEAATAKGAASMNTLMALSSWSSQSLEQVAEAAPRGVRWFYMLFYRDRGRMKRLLERAERAGYAAIVLTVDQPLFPDSIRRKPASFPVQFSLPNVWIDDDQPGPLGSMEHGAGLAKIAKEAATWEDVKWIKNNTRLPVVLKGILSAEDARIAVDLGVAGIYVSNHGGRQQDGVPATIDVLPDIVGAVGGEAEVYLDGGVRTGTDVLKALALGARCVFIGRPALWGLALNGAEGVEEVLQVLKHELSIAMARAGCAKISDIEPSLVVHESYYLYRQLLNHAGKVNNKIVTSKY
ncbi:hydroxyacid oxidase 1-like [Branchiostoma floridae]|uniref:(S)-2-hydroxy-acid oxidase n=1 Tax=Branchiostoma floridae TaxID=7739 RepID=A0A9J7HHL6_BRAFL|nr:hydroxyacid oxidase 1-like [Branchiostoma floridae]